MKQFEITSGDGIALPLSWFPAEQSQWTLLFLPALGIQYRMYNAMAEALAAAGCSVLLMEQRGHGRSPLRASRSVNWGYDHYLQYDIPAALEWIETQAESGNRPLVMGGHSLGGHLSSIFAGQHPERLQGVLHVACGSPYHADFGPKYARLIKFLCHAITLFQVFPGYFPGERLGFAGRESLQLMRDWRYWALSGNLDYGPHHGLEAAIGNFTGALLAVSMAGDQLSTPKAEQRAIAAFTSARRSEVRLGRDASGERPGHFDWAKAPEAVVTTIQEWLRTL
ncbi:MAG TPA: alpha/beta fold hydrolase [Xanthomonadales bacterium]|nr:alpha/beta fold hydrolase [Xanthomonadales bacterium]